MPKIKFISNRPWLTNEGPSVPMPVSKTLPDWYIDADRFAKMPSGDAFIGPDGGKIPTWKACPAVYDIMATGYVERVPCDIEFFYNDRGIISARALSQKDSNFVSYRPPMPQFQVPHGYDESHFAWWAEWGIELPKGYSAIYTHPLNRYELPFMTTNGIIDNDKVNMPGNVPFFVKKGWTGIVEAGTPYMQVIPFKRENWESEISIVPADEIFQRNEQNSKKYRKPNGGVYLRDVWERRRYD